MPEVRDVCSGPARLSREDRERIVGRIHSLLFWVGELIPQEITVEGRTVHLRDIVYHHIAEDVHSPEEGLQADALARLLDEKVKGLEQEIRHGDVTRAQACHMMDEARALLRAVDELRSSPPEEGRMRHRALMEKVDDARRWQGFLKEVR